MRGSLMEVVGGKSLPLKDEGREGKEVLPWSSVATSGGGGRGADVMSSVHGIDQACWS